MALESIRYSNGQLDILDQLLLPAQNKYLPVKGVEDGWKVINRMQVRGAPAIAIVGCLSLAVELFNEQFNDKKSLRQEIEGKLNYLVSARPTAVNVCEDKTNVENSALSNFLSLNPIVFILLLTIFFCLLIISDENCCR